FSPIGRHVVTGHPDGTILLCNLESGAITCTLIGVSRTSWVMFSPDATRILSTTPDAPAQLWDTHTGLPVLSLHAHIHQVFKAASFSPDGRYIAAGYKDGTVRMWDSQDGTCLAVFTEHLAPVTCLTFTPDGEILCSAAEDGTV
ncbi:WD40 repeat-like protein, partial [Polyporus arcularius HHB13444]